MQHGEGFTAEQEAAAIRIQMRARGATDRARVQDLKVCVCVERENTF